MFFTLFKDIINVWYNDAHKLSLFLNAILLPFYIFFFKGFFHSMNLTIKSIENKNFFNILSRIIIYILVLSNFIFFVFGAIGVFQIILLDFIDALVRAIGVFFLILSLILYLRFSKKHHNRQGINNLITFGFYEIVRHPEYFIFFLLSFGLSCSFISFFGLSLTIIQIPVTVIISIKEEYDFSKANESYFDYKNETPMLIPETRTILKKI